MFADEQMEWIRREELELLQLERLKKIVAWSYEKSAFYQSSFRRLNVTPADIQSFEDVGKLPFLTREEIHTVDAFEFLTLPLSSIVRISQIGGVKKFYTRGDIRNNVETMIRSLLASNILRGSIVKLEGDLSDSRLLDVLYALESIGATVVLKEGCEVDTIISLTSDTLTIKNYKLYAAWEIGSASLLIPCEGGYHVQEDNFFVEIADGELIITTLTAQAQPLIRYRTGRQAKKVYEPCPCGRTFTRIDFE